MVLRSFVLVELRGEPVPVVEGIMRGTNGTTAEPRSFDLLPDGRLIGVVTRSDSGRSIHSDLRVVLNWVEELKQRVPIE